MSGSIINLPGDFNISDFECDFLVEVNQDPCQAPQIIRDFDQTWNRISLIEIITRATIHFQGWPLAQGENKYEARLIQAWNAIRHFNPIGMTNKDGRNLLVITTGKNPESTKPFSEIYGISIAAILCERIYNVNYTSFTNVFGRHDFEFLHINQVMKVEAKGRFRRKGRKNALASIEEKFSTIRNFKQAIGIISYPSDTAKRRTPDIELVDPEGEDIKLEINEIKRRILKHYLSFFRVLDIPAIGVVEFLLRLKDKDLTEYLNLKHFFLFPVTEIKIVEIFGGDKVKIQGKEFWGRKTMLSGIPTILSNILKCNSDSKVYMFQGISVDTVMTLFSDKISTLLDQDQNRIGENSANENSIQIFLSDGCCVTIQAE